MFSLLISSPFFALRHMWLPLVVAHSVKAAFWGSGAELPGYLPKWCLKGLGGAMDSLWKIYASNAGREETSICSPLFLASHVYSIFLGTRIKADPSPPLWGAWDNLECKASFGPDIGPAALPWCCFIILLEILSLVICERRRAISRRTLNKCTLCYLEGMIDQQSMSKYELLFRLMNGASMPEFWEQGSLCLGVWGFLDEGKENPHRELKLR